MPEHARHGGEGYTPGRTLREGERVVLVRVANQDTTPRGAVSLELTISDRQADVAAGTAPETDTCRRSERAGYVVARAQVVWAGRRFAQDPRHGGFREVDGVDGNYRVGGQVLPPDVAAGVLATIRARYPVGSAVEVSWERQGAAAGERCHTVFLLPRVRLSEDPAAL